MQQNLRYLIAINYKILGNCEQSNEFYSTLGAEIDREERKELIKYTWGLVLAPLIEDRKLKIRNIEGLETLLHFYDIPEKDTVLHH